MVWHTVFSTDIFKIICSRFGRLVLLTQATLSRVPHYNSVMLIYLFSIIYMFFYL